MDDLQPINIDVPLFAGQNSSIDPRVVPPGELPLVENGRYIVDGQSQKRFGLTSMSQLDTAGNTISAGARIFSAGNALFLHDGATLYLRNSANSNWQPLGGLNSHAVFNTVLAQSRSDIAEIASAATSSAVAIAWTEAGAVKLSIYDPSNGTFLQAATVLAAAGAQPNVVTLGADFFIAWVDTTINNLKLLKIDGDNLTGTGAARDAADYSPTAAAGMTANRHYDICVTNNLIHVVVQTSATSVVINKWNADLTLSSSTQSSSATWVADSRVWCFPLSAGTVVYGNARAWNATTGAGPYAFATAPFTAGLVMRMTGAGTDARNVCWAEVTSTGTPTQNYIAQCSLVPSAGTLTNNSLNWFTNRNCYLASRAFTVGTKVYVWALSDFKLQTQLMLINPDGKAVGRALTNGNAAASDGIFSSLPCVTATTDSTTGAVNYFLASRRRSQLKFDSGGNVSTSVGASLLYTQDLHPTAQAVNVGGSTYISGAAPRLYDGRTLSELGFWFYSDTPTLTVVPGAGSLSAGTYTYAACFAAYDNNGKLWRSPVILVPPGSAQPNGSSGASITAAANDAITISNLSYLQGTSKPNAFIELYRTTADGSEFFKLTEIDNVNQLGLLTTSYTDVAPDSALTGETLYTDGTAPSFLAPPGFAYLTATPNRVYGLATETGEVWTSALTSATAPAQFLLGQTLTVPTTGAPPNSIAIMDGQLYILSRDSILTTNADGTYLAQTQSVQFTPPIALPVDSGCISPGSLLSTDAGLWYQSDKGLMLLTRQRQTQFIGAPVKNYTDTILGRAVAPVQQQIRFVMPTRVLVYDYVAQRWGIHTGQANLVDCALWQKTFVVLSSDGVVRQEVANSFTDDGLYYSRRIITPWIKPAGINGYARCWRFVILGEGRAAHTLQVRIAYQYDDTWIDTLTIANTAANPNGTFGGGLGRFGQTTAGVFGGSAASSYQFEAVMPRQKATAFKFEITDINNSGTGEAAALTMLTLQCGVYPGLARMPASKRTG